MDQQNEAESLVYAAKGGEAGDVLGAEGGRVSPKSS